MKCIPYLLQSHFFLGGRCVRPINCDSFKAWCLFHPCTPLAGGQTIKGPCSYMRFHVCPVGCRGHHLQCHSVALPETDIISYVIRSLLCSSPSIFTSAGMTKDASLIPHITVQSMVDCDRLVWAELSGDGPSASLRQTASNAWVQFKTQPLNTTINTIFSWYFVALRRVFLSCAVPERSEDSFVSCGMSLGPAWARERSFPGNTLCAPYTDILQ